METPADKDYSGFWVKDPEFYKKLLLLAFPIVLQNLITYSVVLADNLMVGRLGETAISGLYMGTLVHTILQILLAGVESAIIILSSQYWGKKDCARIKIVASIGMRLSLALGFLFFVVGLLAPEHVMAFLTPDKAAAGAGAEYLKTVCASYLFFAVSQVLIMAMRSVEIVRIGLINSILAFCVNVVLNYVFIFGKLGCPAMGVRGAALATLISRMLELAVALFFVLKVDKILKLHLKDFAQWDQVIFKDLLRYGTPIMLGQLVWAVNNAFQGKIVGELKATGIASASITGTLDRFFILGVWGLAGGVGIIIGKAIGANEFAKVRQYAKTMQAIFFSIGLISASLVFFGHPLFLSFFNLEAETREMCVNFMYVLSVVQIGRCYQGPALFGLVKSGGDTSFVFKNDTFWVFCWIIPLSLLALYVFNAPAWVVFLCLLSDQITKCFVAFVKINSFNWMKNITRT